MKPIAKQKAWVPWARATALAGIVAPVLAACANSGASSHINTTTKFSSAEYGVAASPRVATSGDLRKGGGRDMVGKPYKVAGRWYTPAENPNYSATGKASWYGPNFHGRLTANGEIFDQYALTAAHPTLPLPSYVRVTNRGNGRSVLVRVNDRGPFAHGRVIDLSKRTAEVLGFINQGTANVHVAYVSRAPVNGDDTRFLVASINKPTALERGGTRLALVQSGAPVPAAAPPRLRSISGWVTDLLSYAEPSLETGQGDALIDSAHAAATAMATRTASLDAWRDSVDQGARSVDLELGAFSNSASAGKVAIAFARLGAVDTRAATVAGRPAVFLTLTHLKPGVTRADVGILAQELGLKDIILY